MRIVVFSDSHRDIDTMIDVVERVGPDMVLHLGDHIFDAADLELRFPEIPMEFVKGNCDLASAAPSQKLITIDGVNIFMTHGDQYGVHNGTSKLKKEGKDRGAAVILYGHTHKPLVKLKKDLTIMNPGRIGQNARGSIEPSFGVLETKPDLTCHTYDYSYVQKYSL